MNWSNFIVPVGLGLTVPFMNRRAMARMTLLRFLGVALPVLGCSMLLAMLLDRLSGGPWLGSLPPIIGAFGISTLVGFLAARYIRPSHGMDEPPRARIEVRRHRERR